MKRALFLAVLCAAVLVHAGEGRAQISREPAEQKYLRVPHRFQIYVDGGIGLPSAPGIYKEYWNDAFQFGAGFGISIQPWLEVNGNFGHASFSLDGLASKGKIGYQGINEIKGGTIKTRTLSGSVRFLAVPKARTNPYVEFGIGMYKTTADDVIIEGVLRNSMKDASGICVAPAVGIQYAMNDNWTAYSKFTYCVNLGSDFAPGDLLLPAGGGQPTEGQKQVISTIVVGIMVRF